MDDLSDNIATFRAYNNFMDRTLTVNVELNRYGAKNSWAWFDDDFDLHSKSGSSSNSSEMSSVGAFVERLILCDSCGVMEHYQEDTKCRGCDGVMEICKLCTGKEGGGLFCDECMGNGVVRVVMKGYSVVGKARLLKRVIKNPKRIVSVELYEEKGKGIPLLMMRKYLLNK